jgi:hypothetical protein
MDLKDLKIVSKTGLEKAKEEFGSLLRAIEYFKENPETKRVDILRIMKSAIEFRDTLYGL